jgi:hypothetical protein
MKKRNIENNMDVSFSVNGMSQINKIEQASDYGQ